MLVGLPGRVEASSCRQNIESSASIVEDIEGGLTERSIWIWKEDDHPVFDQAPHSPNQYRAQ